MSDHLTTPSPRIIHGTDSNSLLRMFDRATAISRSATGQGERKKAELLRQRIVQELQKRGTSM